MAARTFMVATGKVYRGAKSGAINCGAPDYIKYVYSFQHRNCLVVNNSIFQFGKLTGIPSVGSADKITGDSLDSFKRCAAFRTVMLILQCIFISTFRTMVTIMVHGAVTHIVFIHQVYNLHDRFLVVSGITIYLYVEDMSSTCKFMVWSLDLGFVTW